MYTLIVGQPEPTDEELLDKAIDMTAPTGWDKVEAEPLLDITEGETEYDLVTLEFI